MEALDTTHNITSFGEDQAGELYLLTSGGSVFRILQQTQVACPDRPRVTLQSTQSGPGTLTVTLTANDSSNIANNSIQSIAVTRIVNAFVTVGGQVDRQSPFTVTIPGGPRSTQMTVRRQAAGQAFQADFAVTDECGAWTTFVGAGPGLP